jgi:hypothetical protein
LVSKGPAQPACRFRLNGDLVRTLPTLLGMAATEGTYVNRAPGVQAAVLSAGLIAALCTLAALSSENGCGGDGTFSIDSSLADPSSFCTATHFPGFPDTLGSVLLVGAIYVTPVLVVSGGWLVAAATRNRRVGVIGFWAGLCLSVGVIVLSVAAANVGYEGV